MIKKIVKYSSIFLIFYSFIGFFVVPYTVKKIAPSKVLEATNGGVLELSSLSFNPFLFKIDIKELSFKNPQNESLIDIRRLIVDADPIKSIFKNRFIVSNIVLLEPSISIKKDNSGEFNFSWLLEQESEEKSDSDTKVLLERVVIKEGGIKYSDYTKSSPYHLFIPLFGLNLSDIDLSKEPQNSGLMRLYASINDGGFIDIKSNITSLSPLTIDGDFSFSSGKLYTPYSYFKDELPIEVADGVLGLSCSYSISDEKTIISDISSSIDSLRIIKDGENLLLLNNAFLRGGNLDLQKRDFSASLAGVDGFNIYIDRDKDLNTNLQKIINEISATFSSSEPTTPSEPWSYNIDDIKLSHIDIDFSDTAPAQPYSAKLKNLSLELSDISSDTNRSIKAKLHNDSLAINSANATPISYIDLDVDNIEFNLASNSVMVDEVSLADLSIAIKLLPDGVIDITKLLAPSQNSPSTSKPLEYKIEHLLLSNLDLAFDDVDKNVSLSLDKTLIDIKNLTSKKDEKLTLSLDGNINKNSPLKLHSNINLSDLSLDGKIDVKNLDLAFINPYIEPSAYLEIVSSNLSLLVDFKHNKNSSEARGEMALKDWSINNTQNDTTIISWGNIGATPFRYSYPQNQLFINQITVDRFFADVIIDENRTLNFAKLTKNSDEPKSTATSNPFGVNITKFVLRDSSALFSDLSLPLLFKSNIHALEGSVLGISTIKDVSTFVKLRGGVDRYGLAKIDGSLNTKNPKAQTDIAVVFDNLELSDYTPYSLEFLGYKIAGGKLFLDLGYNINNSLLDAKNRVLIKNISLGEERSGGSPWPMRLVVALLEDSDGVIDIDLPIKGDVDNPDFKYGKVVWQVIGNLLTKAVTSPFKLLGSLFGGGDDIDISSIDFEAGEQTLLPPQKEKLQNIITLIQKRPKLSLSIAGTYDKKSDLYILKSKKLIAKAAAMTSNIDVDTTDAISLKVLEKLAREHISSDELSEIKAKIREQFKGDNIAIVKNYTSAVLDKIIPLQQVEDSELVALADARAEKIAEYLIEISDKITIATAKEISSKDSKIIPLELELLAK